MIERTQNAGLITVSQFIKQVSVHKTSFYQDSFFFSFSCTFLSFSFSLSLYIYVYMYVYMYIYIYIYLFLSSLSEF